MKNKLFYTVVLSFGLILFNSINANSQVLISLLLGDKLNSGQIEFGLTGGYGMTNIINEPDSKHLNTFYLGFYFDLLLKKDKPWYIYTGVLVKSRMGASGIPVYSLGDMDMDSVFQGGNINRKISYFNVPIEIKYRFKKHFYVDAGIQAGLMHKALNDLDKKRLQDAFKEEFASRGLEIVSENAVAVVSLYLVIDNKTSTTAYTNFSGGMGVGGLGVGSATTTYSEDDYKEGTLVVDVYDASTKKLIWQGTSQSTIQENASKRDKTIPKKVGKLMSKYPVKPDKEYQKLAKQSNIGLYVMFFKV